MTTFRNFLFIALLIAAGFISLCHTLHYQLYLASGDHGRDLYSFTAAFRGEIPYRDYWWVYGPIMPYYYGFFMKILGVNVTSVLAGKMVMTIVAGIFLALALSFFVPSLLAFAAALWFWAYFPDFGYTYNHIGGIALLMAVTHALLAYLKTGRTPYLYWGLTWIFVLAFIKINFSLAALAAFLIAVSWIDKDLRRPLDGQRKKFYLLGIVILPLLVFAVYLSLVQGLSLAEIRQCFPYLQGDQPYHATPGQCFLIWSHDILRPMLSSSSHLIFGALVLSSLGYDLSLFQKKLIFPRLARQIILAVKILILFYLLNLHEYVGSGIPYRIIWAKPFSLILSFILIGTAIRYTHKLIQLPVVAFLGFSAVLSLHQQMATLLAQKLPDQFLAHPRGQVIIGGNPPQWIDTVQQTTRYLETRLAPGESFLALPYDPIYYYLCDKKTPTRQLIFFEHIKIPPEQERKIIAELERNRVETIVLANRAYVTEEIGMGRLGETHCPLLGQYLKDHFETVASWGEWGKEPGWATNYGTKILKKAR